MPDNTIDSDLEAELGTQVASEEQMLNLRQLVHDAANTQVRIENLEDALKAAKAELHTMCTKTIPAAMASAHTLEHKTDKSVSVEIEDVLHGTLPKDDGKRKAAFNWLADNGASDLVKTEVKASFGRGEHNLAGEITAKLSELGITYEANESVHPQTLAAFARERLRGGKEIPLETLGLYAGRHAVITLPGRTKKVRAPRIGPEKGDR